MGKSQFCGVFCIGVVLFNFGVSFASGSGRESIEVSDRSTRYSGEHNSDFVSGDAGYDGYASDDGEETHRYEPLTSDLEIGSTTTAPKIYDRLNAQQRAMIQSGQHIEFLKNTGDVWPQIVVLQKVNATPEEAIAVFSAFGRHSQYMYRVKQSVAYSTNDPTVTVVDYQLDLPTLISKIFDPRYRVQNKLTKGEDGDFKVTWQMVSSRDIARMEGVAFFEQLPGGGTLVYYSTLMSPRMEGRNFITKKLLTSQKVIDSISRGGGKALSSIINFIENVKATRPDILKSDLERLKEIFP